MNWQAVETFGDIVAEAAALYGAREAFRDERRSLSFEAYAEEIERVAQALEARGLMKGDRIVILAQNRIETAVLLGLCAAGLVPVPLNWRLSVQELARLVADCDPAALVIEDRFAASLSLLAADLPAPPLTIWLDGAPDGGGCGYVDLAAPVPEGRRTARAVPVAADPCCIIYTSGTTGQAKGVVITHRGAVLNCRDVSTQIIPFGTSDIVLAVMPLFHVGGIWYYLFPSFASGAKTIIQALFHPQTVSDALAADRVTNIHVVPTMLADLLATPGFVEAAASLRTIVYAGTSMPIDLLRRALALLPGRAFVQAYGSTEAGAISTLGPDDHLRALADPAVEGLLRSCGRALEGTEVRLDVPAGASVDTMGEILVRSEKTMNCYWRNPAATAERIEDGWLYTGDIGQRDPAGYLYIVDRKNDMVVSGGENIFPFEVEEVLCRHGCVSEAAAFGIPDPRWVERLVAAVVLRPGSTTTEADIVAYARTRLGGYKTPKQVFVVPDLPKSAVGKVLRRALRERFAQP